MDRKVESISWQDIKMTEVEITQPMVVAKMAELKGWIDEEVEPNVRSEITTIKVCMKRIHKAFGEANTRRNHKHSVIKSLGETYQKMKELGKSVNTYEEKIRAIEAENKRLMELRGKDMVESVNSNNWGGMEKRMEELFEEQREWWRVLESEKQARKEEDVMGMKGGLQTKVGKIYDWMEGRSDQIRPSSQITLVQGFMERIEGKMGILTELVKELSNPMHPNPESRGVADAIKEHLKESMMYCEVEMRKIKEEVVNPYLEQARRDRKEGKDGEGMEWGDVKKSLNEIDGGMKAIKGAIEETKERMKGCERVVKEEAKEIRKQVEGVIAEGIKRGKDEDPNMEELINKTDGIVRTMIEIKEGVEAWVSVAPCFGVTEHGESEKLKGGVDVAKAITDIRDGVMELKERVGAPTYAEVLTAPKPVPARMVSAGAFVPAYTNHAVIVSSREEKDSSNDVFEKVKKSLDARATGITVNRVTKIRNKKIIISCERKEEIEKIEKRISKEKDLVIEQPKSKDPMVRLVGLLQYNKEKDIIEAMKNQNKKLWEGIEKTDFQVTERFRRRMRNELLCTSVLQVTPIMYKKIMEVGKLHIDLQQVVVEDQTPLRQCTRCLGYGHGRKHCSEKKDICSHCGGVHLRSACESFKEGRSPTCRNCAQAGIETKEHGAFSDECPVKKKWDAIARATINYMS